MRTLLIGLAMMLACGCGERVMTEPPEITSEQRDESTNLVFWLRSHEVREDGSQWIRVEGLAGGRPVGFEIEIGTWYENGPGFVDAKSYQATTRLHSLGVESDELVRQLDSIYQAHAAPRPMNACLEMQAISFIQKPGQFEEPVKLILSIQPGFDERDYAEVFLAIDKPHARVLLTEKDRRYRGTFVRALSGSA